jgi:hypothetical protein
VKDLPCILQWLTAGRVAGSDFTAQHNVTMWRWLIAACFVAEMKRENGNRRH